MSACKICGGDTKQIFSKTILGKYPANYYQCRSCDFVQTSEPIWLKEAYSNAITNLDIGLLNRNMRMLNEIPKIIDTCFPTAKIMLDFAGGYGVFTRLMRDHGYNFFRQDIYCENTFAKHFDIENVESKNFDVVTAFEVFEHFENPLKDIEGIFDYGNNVIFSTELIPSTVQEIENWWYVAEETGQHIAFYSLKSLQFLAKKWGKNLYTKNGNLHVFTNVELNQDQIDFAFNNITERSYFFGLRKKSLYYHVQRNSLLEPDFNYIRSLER